MEGSSAEDERALSRAGSAGTPPSTPPIARPSTPPSARPSGTPRSGADYNLKVTWTLARYIEQNFGAEGLRQMADAGGMQPSDFDLTNRWVTWEAFEAILSKARSFMKSDEEYRLACVYRLREAYGPLRYILWATTPAQVLAMACKHLDLLTSTGELAFTSGRTWGHMSFKSSVPFSRLNCLTRHAQSAALPTLWGLPPAYLRESACIARGDPTCEIHAQWYAGRGWILVILGAVLFAALGFLLVRLGVTSVPPALALGMVGALLGYLVEGRRAESLNERTRQEVMDAFQQLAHEERDARRELLDMHARQKDWTRLVEEEMGARTTAFQKLASGVKELHEARATALLGVSHDLRNPLQIIQMSAEYLRSAPGVTGDPDAAESVRDIGQSVERMRRMLGDLVQATKAQRDFVTMAPQSVQTTELYESLRGRLRALMHGRDVRTTVFTTREAPPQIEMDPLALDRIVDNLLTNAAKYTERGSVIVELDGIAGYLVIKVSDTGCGIDPDALEQVFQVGGSSPESRRGDSFGVGLSVVVQLLRQIGGWLEVMSRPGSGTTFWVYLPIRYERQSTPSPVSLVDGRSVDSPRQSTSRPLGPVVKIRKLPA